MDYYSDFVKVQELSVSLTDHHSVSEQFSRHGIPNVLDSDNGLQLTSQECRTFTAGWEFKHLTKIRG